MMKYQIILLSLLFTTPLFANNIEYSGQEVREIKSLSENDIRELKNGSGWGLAKAAELNGLPGPAHVLEMQDKLHLSKSQVTKVEKIWQNMNSAAKTHGELYIQAEKSIENFFQEKVRDEKSLFLLIEKSAQQLALLRRIHLNAHLELEPILSKHQVMLYNQYRGYINSSKNSQLHH